MRENQTVFAVDLDNTLLRSDSLWEMFLSALGCGDLRCLLYLPKGPVAFKEFLARSAPPLDLGYLPWNEDVIALARQARTEGREVWLVTAANILFAERVAAHFGFFSGVLATDGHTNLKGAVKAEVLVKRFGHKNFDYCGDSAADIPVWQACREAVCVNPSERLMARLRRVNPLSRRLDSSDKNGFELIKICLRSVRLKQWLKNTLIAVPLLLMHKFTWPAFQTILAAFLSFSLCASALYLFNDMLDLAADRRHPVKKNRPLASGALPVPRAFLLALALLVLSFFWAFDLAPHFAAVLAGYAALTLAYFFIFKKMLVADSVCLGFLYTLRVIAGAEALQVSISVWLLSFSFFIFLGLAFIKRLIEIRRGHNAADINLAGRGYRFSEGRIIETMSASAGFTAIIILALYIESAQALRWYANPKILWGICPVILYWYCRLLLLVHRGEVDYDPVAFAGRDRISLACGLISLSLILLAI